MDSQNEIDKVMQAMSELLDPLSTEQRHSIFISGLYVNLMLTGGMTRRQATQYIRRCINEIDEKIDKDSERYIKEGC